MRRDPDLGTVTMTVELPLESGALIDKALDRARDETASNNPEFVRESWAAQQADALVAMAKAYLQGGGDASAGTHDHYQVTVHVDHSALADGNCGRGTRAAASPVAGAGVSSTPTISNTGQRAARPVLPT
jgi:hypothetical protein